MGSHLEHFGGLGGDLCRNGWSMKMSTTMAFWLHFRVLGGLVGGSRGYLEASWREVGLSWAILASSWDLMAACWKKDGEEERRLRNWMKNGWLEATKHGLPRSGLARTGRCLELEFRDLERS